MKSILLPHYKSNRIFPSDLSLVETLYASINYSILNYLRTAELNIYQFSTTYSLALYIYYIPIYFSQLFNQNPRIDFP